MAEVQIDKMRIKHEAILDWLLLNPEKTQGECAAEFGVTETWLSVIVNSDVFKSRLRERRLQMDMGVNAIIEGRARGVVAKGLERLEKLVEVSEDPRFVLDTTDKVLARLGYGPKSAAAGMTVNVQNNTITVGRDVLARARGEIVAEGARLGAEGTSGERAEVVIDVPAAQLAAPAQATQPEAIPAPAPGFPAKIVVPGGRAGARVE